MKGPGKCFVRPPSLWEKSYAVSVLLLSTGAFLNLGQTVNMDANAGMPEMEILWTLIYMVTIILSMKQIKCIKTVLNNELCLCLFIGFAVASTVWSDSSLLTARRSLALVCTTLFGIYFGIRYPLKLQLRILAVTFTLAAVVSAIFQLLGIGNSVDVGVPGWIGIYVQKNGLGLNMALGSAILVVVNKCDREYKWRKRIGFIITLTLLVMSKSMTAALMFAAAIIVILICEVIRRNYRTLVLTSIIWIPALTYIIVWCLNNIDLITQLLGRDSNLTGRIPLWLLSVQMALQKPLMGYGYNAFWRGYDGASAAIWRVLGWNPPHSHNGFIELWLGLGLIGLSMFFVTLWVYSKRAVLLVRKESEYESMWPIVFLALFIVSNLTEAKLLSANSITWIIYVAVGVHSGMAMSNSAVLSKVGAWQMKSQYSPIARYQNRITE